MREEGENEPCVTKDTKDKHRRCSSAVNRLSTSFGRRGLKRKIYFGNIAIEKMAGLSNI